MIYKNAVLLFAILKIAVIQTPHRLVKIKAVNGTG
nr:MAG TPA: hypothetical protein [Bacteriophage sp.]DAP66250.1 MAG TPA: hypothetical protein [Caudoviricetes sp.]